MADIFTSTGVLITPSTREMQLEFHDCCAAKEKLVAEFAPTRKAYDDLRAQGYSGSSPKCMVYRDKILAHNLTVGALNSKMGALTKAVEAVHVLAKDGVNARPGVATMGTPQIH